MTLLGLRDNGYTLLCRRRARLLCWWVSCDLTLGLLFRWCPVLGL